MDKEIFTSYTKDEELLVNDEVNLDKKLDMAILEYMKAKRISTLDIIATEIKDTHMEITTNIQKSNMRPKEEI